MFRKLSRLYTFLLMAPVAIFFGASSGIWAAELDAPEYSAVQLQLAQGWNTWNTRSVLQQVLLPDGIAINLAFKKVAWLSEPYLPEALIGRREEGAPIIRPGLHSYSGSYTELHLEWQGYEARVETAHSGNDLVVLVTPLSEPDLPMKMIVEVGMLWNRPGQVSRQGDRGVYVETSARRVKIFTTTAHQEDYYVQTLSPYLVIPADRAVGVATGRPQDLIEIRHIVKVNREALEAEAAAYGDLAEAYLAVQGGVAWNLVYEPTHDRVVSTVGRLWNEQYGGYCLFGWDNFFLAYITALSDRDLAIANVIEHLRGATAEGFIPNDNRGNGSKSFDRSQPPVGGIMVREILKVYPEWWFLETVFDPLLEWNRWWLRRRLNDGLLSYGSHEAPNPFLEPSVRSRRTAGYESGMDDSPMYEDVPFNPERNTLELQDVGLTSLVLADTLALAEMAEILGRDEELQELKGRATSLSAALETVWDSEAGLYLNRRSDTGEPSHRLSPTLFYPLIAGAPGPERAERMVSEHLLNPEEFWGRWVVPSIARSDPAFPKQRYWKGAIWPPLNFLTYLGLRRAGFSDVASQVAEKSLDLFLQEWHRQGFVSENYSAITGTGDDERLSSDRFHSWGALMGIMAFVEGGFLPPPESTLVSVWATSSDSRQSF